MRKLLFQVTHVLLLFLLPACSLVNNHKKDYSSQLAADEQCKILGKKRLHVEKSPWRFKKVNSSKYDRVAKNKSQEKSIRTGSTNHSDSHLAQDEALNHDTIFLSNSVVQNVIPNPAKKIALTSTDNDSGIALTNAFQNSKAQLKKESKAIATEDTQMPYLVTLGGLMSIVLLSFTKGRAKQLSVWAARNPLAARGLIASIKTGVALTALAAGNQLSNQGISMADGANYGAMGLFAASAMFYPTGKYSSYLRRKTHDVGLFTASTLLMMCAGNHYDFVEHTGKSAPNAIYSMTSYSNTHSTFNIIEKDFASAIKQEPAKEKSTGLKIILTLLALAAFATLGYGLAVLACNISCAGYDGLAILTLLGGGTGLVILLVMALKRIFKGKRKDQASLQQA